MSLSRRELLKTLLLASATLLPPFQALASIFIWPRSAFNANTFNEAVEHLFQQQNPLIDSQKIQINAPNTAKTTGLIHVSIKTSLDQVEKIALFIKEEEQPLVASFQLSASALAELSSNLQLSQSCTLVAVVQSSGKLYSHSKKIRVSSGGCGD